MPLLAGSVIDAARDLHPAFDPKRHPNKLLLRALSRYVRQLHGRVAAVDADSLRVEQSFPLPLADFEGGITLPDNRFVAEVVAAEPDTATKPRTYPVTLISAEQRFARNGPLAAAWQIGNKLYLRGPAETWRFMGSIAVAYIAAPVELVALGDALGLPDTAESACVEYMALVMARRTPGAVQPPIDVGSFVASADRAEKAFMDDVQNRLTGRVFFTEDVWP